MKMNKSPECHTDVKSWGKIWAIYLKNKTKHWPKEDAVNLGTHSHIFKDFGNVVFKNFYKLSLKLTQIHYEKTSSWILRTELQQDQLYAKQYPCVR